MGRALRRSIRPRCHSSSSAAIRAKRSTSASRFERISASDIGLNIFFSKLIVFFIFFQVLFWWHSTPDQTWTGPSWQCLLAKGIKVFEPQAAAVLLSQNDQRRDMVTPGAEEEGVHLRITVGTHSDRDYEAQPPR